MKQLTEKNGLLTKVRQAASLACQRIAPSWPLDKAIAVNPWWQMRKQPFKEVAANLAVLGGVQCLMPTAYYRAMWQRQIKPVHLTAAIETFGIEVDHSELLSYLEQAIPEDHWLNISDWLDAQQGNRDKISWRDEITQQISQFCGLYFQYPQWRQFDEDAENDFYQNWLAVIQQDRGVEILTAEANLHRIFFELPEQTDKIFEMAYLELFPKDTDLRLFTEYCYALLLDIHGWAAYLAYAVWQDNLAGRTNKLLEQLLSIRIAWDWVLWKHTAAAHPKTFVNMSGLFTSQFAQLKVMQAKIKAAQRYLWVWQRALEFSFQFPLQQQLLTHRNQEISRPSLQAFFCIDVRSEPYRRALEAQDPTIQTFGFAGFFGLPIEYAPFGEGYVRPQLPGLLKPTVRATPLGAEDNFSAHTQKVKHQVYSQQTGDASPSSLGFVEAKGLWHAFDLLKKSLFPSAPEQGINQMSHHGNWLLTCQDKLLTFSEQAEMVAGILRTMGLTNDFADTILLVGHGSCSANNPHAASLDCGACGGQTGEVNVKVLAQLLNNEAVRAELNTYAIHIPPRVKFVASVHNTTTDEITCFTQAGEGKLYWAEWLVRASKQAQTQRLASFSDSAATNFSVEQFYSQKTRDWGELRPEWGLVNNAAFIVAPRTRTRHLNLEGRCFLHDYKWRDDADFTVLELIMTAPMVVTHWINLQYYASVADNFKYGCGNKMLHNVVGGNIGVFEGNGGDLRIGLPLQSLHDGRDWRHQPIRLSVYIAAPRDAMAEIIDKHETLASLINNQWLFLFQLDDGANSIWQYQQSQWRQVMLTGDSPCTI